ncbi:hypothetical protein Taro_023330 [Colocasia esculenta]|uniref:Short-chain dehydrogenase TIC 32, chloroplastic n=1 Tax=Colocasia esculenta TaxID=4460 RepID=A0A843V4D1_COLES|nr:hypothetical protein [Colocasia esculenta]
MWPFSRTGPSGFSSSSTAEEVTEGVDGRGLTAVITGASSGIGAETARVLALRGVHVVMGVRNLTAGANVKESILKEIPTAKIDVLELDLTSLASVRKFASEFNSTNLPLNILINNAGVMATPFSLSKDGIELQFATNHVGHFLLTNLLLGNMENTSHTSNIEGRIVNVSSEGHRFAYREGVRFDKINSPSEYSILKPYMLVHSVFSFAVMYILGKCPKYNYSDCFHISFGAFIACRYNQLSAYGQSKLANILHANELSKLLKGAATTCYVALNPQVQGISGKYFENSNLATPSAKATDADLAKKLWDFSLSLVG